MSKLMYANIFFVAVVILSYNLYSVRGKKDPMSIQIRRLLLACLNTNVFYLLILIFNDYNSMRIAYAFYFSSMSWLCMFLLQYVVVYTDTPVSKHWVNKLVIIFLFIDSVSCIGNIFWGNAYTFEVIMIGSEMYLSWIAKIPFYFHLIYCYCLLILTFYLLIKKILSVPRFYRSQYSYVLVLLCVIVVSNAIFMMTDLHVDVSILGYGMIGVIFNLYVKHVMPSRLKSKMSSVVTSEINIGIILFNIKEELIYVNKAARDILPVRIFTEKELNGLFRIENKNKISSYDEEIRLATNDSRIIKVTYKRLTEKQRNGKVLDIGSYYQLYDITKDREELKRREHLATHDPLTDLHNKTHFWDLVSKQLDKDPDTPYIIAITNIRGFKLYNEVFGVDEGDKLLRHIGKIIRDEVKDSRVLYAHYDADRFVLCAPAEYAKIEMLKKYSLLSPITVNGFKIINNVGLYVIEDKSVPPSTMCERAAIAVNTISQSSPLQYAFYSESMRSNLIREAEIISAFPKALLKGQFVAYVQPQFEYGSNNLVGGEVLVRWITSSGKVISPGEFIPVLERNGLITELDMYIWEETYLLCAGLHQEGYPISLSVNLSAQDFYRCDLVRVFTGLSKKYNLDPKYIKLEITESEIMSNLTKLVPLIKQLQESGFIFEMDDFGSAFSSLNTLKDIPVNVLKMDMLFLRGTDDAEKSWKIISGVCFLAKQLGLPMIAEGVETKEQADKLHMYGCDYIQGYYYSKPIAASDFCALRKEKEFVDVIR